MALDAATYDPILFGNLKVMTDAMNQAVILSSQNAVANQQAMQLIGQRAVASAIDDLGNTSVAEGLGIASAQSGSLGPLIAALAAAIGGAQVVTKGAQTTPPVTAAEMAARGVAA